MKKQVFMVSVFVLTLSIISLCFPVSTSALSDFDYVKSGSTYYIKNIKSGKYLDVYNNSTSDGTKVIQYKYTGRPNQQWKVTEYSNGSCKLVSLSSNKLLTIENSGTDNGVAVKINSSRSGASQIFWIEPNADGYSARILTNVTKYSKCVVTKGASIGNGVQAIQYTYRATKNDQWQFEPADAVVAANGANYAYQNFDTHTVTYPNCEELGGDCANFVSQCMVASGVRYKGEWFVNKKNENYLTPTNPAQLDDTWELEVYGWGSSPWISAVSFKDYWLDRGVPYRTCTSRYIVENSDKVYNWDFARGDVIQYVDSFDRAQHTMYISGYNHYNGKINFAVSYHTSANYQRNIVQIAQNDLNNNINRKYYFYKMY